MMQGWPKKMAVPEYICGISNVWRYIRFEIEFIRINAKN